MIIQSLLILFVSLACGLQDTILHHGPESGVGASEKPDKETVKIQMYYESLCPDCIGEYPQLPPLVKKIGDQLTLQTYPYGNAQMVKDKSGAMVVRCQHGEAECYGNMLHACAIEQLQDTLIYIPYVACMMASRSNDTAADECGKLQGINSYFIKKCAKGTRGHDLLVFYGKESQKVNYRDKGVPYVLVNGQYKPDGQTLMDAVCQAFKIPPDACNHIPQSTELLSDYI